MNMKKLFFVLLCCCTVLLTSCQLEDSSSVVPGFDVVVSSKNYEVDDTFFSDKKFIRPMGIVFTPQHIVIADQGHDALLLYDMHGRYEQTIGSIGKGPVQFLNPTALVWQNDKLYVLDAGNNRIQVLNEQFEYMAEYHLTKIESDTSYTDLAVTTSGQIYVTTEYGMPQYAHIYTINPENGQQSLIGNSLVGTICTTSNDRVFFVNSYELYRENGGNCMRSGKNSLYEIDGFKTSSIANLPHKYTCLKVISFQDSLLTLSFNQSRIDRLGLDGTYQETIFQFENLPMEMLEFGGMAYQPELDYYLVSMPEAGRVVCIRKGD